MKKKIMKVLVMVLGNALLAYGFAVFAIPANIIVGGATGVGLIIEKVLGIDYALCVFILNMVMLWLGYVCLGKAFALGTILSSFLFPMFLAFFENMTVFQNVTNDLLLSCVYAGVFSGLGLGLVFRQGFSTGGLDVPPLIFHRYYHVNLGVAINLLDSLVLLGQIFFFSFESILYGLLTAFISSYVINQISILGQKKMEVLVISEQYEKIAQAIDDRIDRGCTFVNITTGYMKKNSQAIMCVVDKTESIRLQELVLDLDKEAFMIAHEVHSVHGRGFTLPNLDLDNSQDNF